MTSVVAFGEVPAARWKFMSTAGRASSGTRRTIEVGHASLLRRNACSVSSRSGVSARPIAVLCTRKDSKILILSSCVEVVFGELEEARIER